jgi:hypothetical protein
MKYAIDNDINSFVLIVDKQSQVRVGKSLKHDITDEDVDEQYAELIRLFFLLKLLIMLHLVWPPG